MLTTERQKKIKELLIEHSHIEVSTLSNIFGVSEVTIRKDLDKMENEGIVTRFHGAVMLNVSKNNSIAFDPSADDIYAKDKRLIGNICSELIQDNDIIYIGDGSTCYNVAKQLKSKTGLTIVTNNINALGILSNTANSVISVGGALHTNGNFSFTAGTFSEQMIAPLQFTKVFLSVNGIHSSFGLTLSDPGILSFYKLIRSKTHELIIVCDSSKFDRISMLKFCDINDVDTIVASADISDTYKQHITEQGVKLYTTIQSNSPT